MLALTGGQALDSRFTLIRRLGAGGMGEVWLVRDEELGEEVVAKILAAGADSQQRARLQSECREARKLRHPNIVRVFDFHAGGEYAFVTMERVEGQEIGRLRGRSPMEILRALTPVADALTYLHARALVHRDLKPANVLIDEAGQAHLIDFGIAGRMVGAGEETVVGGGSPGHVGPQQLAGEPPHPADDVYAFGVLIYELITGHPPFWPEMTAARVREETPAPMRSAWPLPPSLASLVERLLAKAPGDRPATMGRVQLDLEAILDELEARHAQATQPPQTVLLKPPPVVEPVARPTEETGPRVPAPSPPVPHKSRTVPPFITGAAFGALAFAAVFVFFLLPRWVDSRSGAVPGGSAGEQAPVDTGQPAQPPPASPAPSETERAEQQVARDHAQQQLERVVELQGRLADAAIELWGAVRWEAAEFHAALGDERLKSGDPHGAREAYEQALTELEALDSEAGDVLHRTLEEGQVAVARGDADAAQSAFGLAAAIAPGNSQAAAGLKRAEALEELQKSLRSGAEAETRGDLVAAEQSYRRAVALDPQSAAAGRALVGIRARIADDTFALAMSEGLDLLERGEYAAASEAFRRADTIKPGSPQAADGLARASQADTLDAIGKRRFEAEALEAEERWHAALEAYRQVLTLDDDIGFAQRGRDRTAARGAMADAITFHLDHPERLSTDAVHAEARELLVRARETEPAGSRHRRQVEELASLLESAGTHVRVWLVSDEQTEVVVYRVGRLGRFTRRSLDLRPGTYTVIGSRSGYRDVRHHLVVMAGEEPAPLTVRCEEEI